MEEMPAWNKVPAEELAVALGSLVVWLPFAILDTPVKSTYLINQQELDRIRETGKEGVSLHFDKRFGPEVELRSPGTAEITFVRGADDFAGADNVEVRVSLPL